MGGILSHGEEVSGRYPFPWRGSEWEGMSEHESRCEMRMVVVVVVCVCWGGEAGTSKWVWVWQVWQVGGWGELG